VAWKIVGIIESRAGDLEILPEWAVGTPNCFDNIQQANLVRDSMQAIVDQQRAPRGGPQSPDVPKLPPIKYMLVPSIDTSTIDQLNGKHPTPQPQQQQASPLSFGVS
jgi:hypothetical protein